MLETHFGVPEEWPAQDLIGYTEEFQASLVLLGYRCGVFPMPLAAAGFDGAMGWFSPMERARIELDRLRVTRSLRKSAKRYTTTVDTSFDQVIAACGDPARPDGWIDERITTAYQILHRGGYVHSVETWDQEGRLVGGLYGVHQSGLVAGESMFHDPDRGRDASKVALIRLIVEMRRIGANLLDVQWLTPHLKWMGASVVPRERYLQDLGEALARPHTNAWSRGEPLDGDDLLELYAAGATGEGS